MEELRASEPESDGLDAKSAARSFCLMVSRHRTCRHRARLRRQDWPALSLPAVRIARQQGACLCDNSAL
jgi:hypothetical protein